MVTQQQILLTELAARERLLRDQRTATEQAETLLQILDALQGTDDPTRAFEAALELARQALDADLAIVLRQPELGSDAMETVLASDPDFGLSIWPMAGHDLLRPLCITDIHETSMAARLAEQALGYRALIAAPLVDPAGPNVGPRMALVLLSRRTARFARTHHGFMQRIGAIMARSVQYRQMSQRNAMLTAIVAGTAATQSQILIDDPSLNALGWAFDRLTNWQNRIIDLNNDLLSAPGSDVDSAIDRALAEIGRLLESDRTYVFRLNPQQTLDNTHEWVAPGIAPMKQILQNVPAEVMDDWRADFEAGLPVAIPDVAALPAASTTRDILQMQGIVSLLAVPMLRDGVLTGFVGHDFVRAQRHFLPTEIRLLQSVANTIGAVTARRLAEMATLAAQTSLAQERDRLQATLAALPDLVLELDQDGRFIGYNFGGGTQPAYAPEDFLGRLVEEVLPPALARIAREVMREVDVHGNHLGAEYSLPSEDGERWYLVSAGARRCAGRSNGYVFLIRDITERYHNEREIRRLGRIAELTSNLVVITDPEGQIDWVNPAFETRTGWTLDEVRSRKHPNVDVTDTAPRIRSARTEVLNRSRSGEEYWVTEEIQPLIDTQGRLEGFLTVQTDITLLKQKHRLELRLRATAINASMDGISICGPDGRYLYMNPAHRNLFGIAAHEDVRALGCWDVMPPATKARLLGEIWPKLESERHWRGELRGLHRDGRFVELDVSLTLIETGELICILRDVTERYGLEAERMRLRDQLQLAQRRETVAYLASGVAHDLNNLVAVVSGTVTLLQTSGQLGTEVSTGLGRIARAMDAAHDLVHGLGQLGRGDMPKSPQDLRKLVIEAIDLLGSERVRHYGIHAEFPAAVQTVWANQTELLQVIVNLALNACEAGNEGRNQVMLTVAPEGATPPAHSPDSGEFDSGLHYRFLRIQDKGEGIDPALRPRLFERYLTTKGPAGTGLGLPIVASILRDNQAALWFESTWGQGTTVTVAWPSTAPTQQESLRVTSPDGVVSDLSGHQILVVDDNIDVAEVLSGMIEAAGAIAIALADPVEALELIRENPGLWSALVTDFDMPDLNGEQLAKAAAASTPPLPSVLVTALPERNTWAPGVFHAVHAKPVAAADLIQSLRTAISTTVRP
jgi:PAS domain S-box-containing protein